MRFPQPPGKSKGMTDQEWVEAWDRYKARLEVWADARGDRLSWPEYTGLCPREKGWLCALVMKRVRHGAPFAGIRPPSEFEAQCLLLHEKLVLEQLGMV